MRKLFTTSDHATLSYIDQGNGKPVLFLHGGAQAAEQFKYQINALTSSFRVIAIDMRGHGQSPAPGFGYRISRYAKDIHEFLNFLSLNDVAILGHSMGCSVIWNYIDLFGQGRLSKLILVDEPTFCMANPCWKKQTLEQTGAMFNIESLYPTLNALEGEQSEETIKNFVNSLTTEKIASEDKAMIIRNMLEMPKEAIASLYLNNIMQDWRDVIKRITLPTLVIGAYNSAVDWLSQEWIHQQIPGSKLDIFDENHFMFLENPQRFNTCLVTFLKSKTERYRY